MKRTVRQVLGSLFVAAGGALLLGIAPGCADSESTLFIRQVQIPQQSSGNVCTVDNSPSSSHRLSGVLDVALASQYEATLLVGNQMIDRGSKDDLRTETSRVQIGGSEVYVKDAAGRVIAGPYTVPSAGLIDPASGSNPSYGTVDSVLVDSVTASKLASELGALPRGTIRRLTAHVKVFGRTLGGTDVESGEWQFPIDACFGCLVSYPREADDPNIAGPDCRNPSAESNIPTPCSPGQDDPVDCRLCHGIAPGSGVCDPVDRKSVV